MERGEEEQGAARGTCGVCGGAGRARRDLAALCGDASPYYMWICQFCSKRATQCIKFIARVRNSEELLRNTTTDEQFQVTDTYSFTTVSFGPFAICSHNKCNTYSYDNTFVHEDKAQVKRESLLLDYSEHKIKIESEMEEESPRTDENVSNEICTMNLRSDAAKIKGTKVQKKPTKTTRKCKSKAGPKALRIKELLKKAKNKCIKVHLTKEELLKEIELRRQKPRYAASKFKCDRCGLCWNDAYSWEQHVQKRHDESLPMACDICGYRFPCARTLAGHTREHQRRWRCLNCSALAPGLDKCLVHYEECTDTAQPTPCDVCGKVYKSPYAMSRHRLAVHEKQKKYSCDECQKSFKHKGELETHIRTHTGWRPFECDICGKKSLYLTVHKQHMKFIHGPRVRSENLYCVECDMYFRSKLCLRQHLRLSLKHVSKESYTHQCNKCADKFRDNSLLVRHYNTVHLMERSYRCSLCVKAYYSRSALTLHIRNKHTNANQERTRDVICSVCGKGFYDKKNLQMHIVGVHSTERPFACQLCPATFGFRASLYTHGRLKHGRKKKTES